MTTKAELMNPADIVQFWYTCRIGAGFSARSEKAIDAPSAEREIYASIDSKIRNAAKGPEATKQQQCMEKPGCSLLFLPA